MCLQLFTEEENILRRIGEDRRMIQMFYASRKKTKSTASEAIEAEAILGDIPNEFLDLIKINNIFFTYILVYKKEKKNKNTLLTIQMLESA